MVSLKCSLSQRGRILQHLCFVGNYKFCVKFWGINKLLIHLLFFLDIFNVWLSTSLQVNQIASRWKLDWHPTQQLDFFRLPQWKKEVTFIGRKRSETCLNLSKFLIKQYIPISHALINVHINSFCVVALFNIQILVQVQLVSKNDFVSC